MAHAVLAYNYNSCRRHAHLDQRFRIAYAPTLSNSQDELQGIHFKFYGSGQLHTVHAGEDRFAAERC